MRITENFAAIATALNRGLARIVIAPSGWKRDFVSGAKVSCSICSKSLLIGEPRVRTQLHSVILKFRRSFALIGFLLLITGCCAHLYARDQPQWGEAWSRNMVSSEKN